MEHVSELIADLDTPQPSAHDIEAAGQVPFDFAAPIKDGPDLDRPTDGSNLSHVVGVTEMVETGEYTVAGDAAEGPAREPFGAWLLAQKDRKGWIGDLAKAAKNDPRFPKRGDPDEVRKRLKELGADGDSFEAVDDAEMDWLAL